VQQADRVHRYALQHPPLFVNIEARFFIEVRFFIALPQMHLTCYGCARRQEMQVKAAGCAIVLGLLLAAAATAQGTLAVSADSPQIDGVISPGEYSLDVELPRGTLYLNRTDELLSVALQSELDGWVAVGLGSRRMNEASIYIGYVDSGEQVFAEQLGRGHGHADAPVAEPIAYQLKDNQTGTVLEINFPISAFIPEGATSLALIAACGKQDDLTSYHSMRKGLEIDL
jgi:hypothetical protein